MGTSDQQHCFNVCADLIQYQSCYCYHGDHQPLRWLVCQHSDVVLAQTHRLVVLGHSARVSYLCDIVWAHKHSWARAGLRQMLTGP